MQTLRRLHRRGRSLVPGAAGPDPGLPGAQWGRQDHHPADDPGSGEARLGAHRRIGRDGSGEAAREGRVPARGARPLPAHDAAGRDQLLRKPEGRSARRGAPPGPADAGGAGTGCGGPPPDPPPVKGHGPEGPAADRPGARAGAGPPGRAVLGPGSGEPAILGRGDPRPRPPRGHGGVLDPRDAARRAPLRRGRVDRRRAQGVRRRSRRRQVGRAPDPGAGGDSLRGGGGRSARRQRHEF